MKAMTTAIAATLLIASMGASANTMRTATDTIETGFAPTKAAAYKAGIDKLNQLKSVPSNVLEYKVSAPLGMIESGTLKVNDNSFIVAQERVSANGQKGYVGVINVGLSFEEHDSDN